MIMSSKFCRVQPDTPDHCFLADFLELNQFTKSVKILAVERSLESTAHLTICFW